MKPTHDISIELALRTVSIIPSWLYINLQSEAALYHVVAQNQRFLC